MIIILPQKIGSIIACLNKAGFPAHIVGGCVRDLFMGKEPHDWDITTSAVPEQVKKLFGKTWDTGLRHGTVTVNFDGQSAEITTWRTDTAYMDHRHPDRVEFTNSLEEDLSRRDFTMNAMAYHPDEGLFDPFNGLEDIKNRLIRSVGDPLRRFGEDALRMLRALRFSAQLGFGIEQNTYAAVKKLHADISYVSAERIRSELDKIFDSADPGLVSLIWDTGMNSVVFPEIGLFPEVCPKVCQSLPPAPENRILILSALFHGAFDDCCRDKVWRVMRRLKYDNGTINKVTGSIRAIEVLTAVTPRNIRQAAHLYGREAASHAVRILLLERGESVDYASRAANHVEEPMVCKVTGSDLLDARLGSGKEIGLILGSLNLCLYENPLLNDRETLMALAAEIHRKFRNDR